MKSSLDNSVVKNYSLSASVGFATLGGFGSDVNNKIGVRRKALGAKNHFCSERKTHFVRQKLFA